MLNTIIFAGLVAAVAADQAGQGYVQFDVTAHTPAEANVAKRQVQENLTDQGALYTIQIGIVNIYLVELKPLMCSNTNNDALTGHAGNRGISFIVVNPLTLFESTPD